MGYRQRTPIFFSVFSSSIHFGSTYFSASRPSTSSRLEFSVNRIGNSATDYQLRLSSRASRTRTAIQAHAMPSTSRCNCLPSQNGCAESSNRTASWQFFLRGLAVPIRRTQVDHHSPKLRPLQLSNHGTPSPCGHFSLEIEEQTLVPLVSTGEGN